MENIFLKFLDYGALGLLDLIFMVLVIRYAPRFIDSQTKLAINLQALSRSIDNNTKTTEEQMMTTRTALEELKYIKKRIDEYDVKTAQFKEQQQEMLEVLKEIKLSIERS